MSGRAPSQRRRRLATVAVGLTLAADVIAQPPVQTPLSPPSPARLDGAFARAGALPRLRSLLVAVDGRLVREGYWRGAGPGRATNVKSASKSLISALFALLEQHILPAAACPAVFGAIRPAARAAQTC